MSLSIAQKLIAAFVGLTLLVLAATLGLARWSFEQGFLDYVNALEQTRLERLQADLASEYLSAGRNWQFLSEAYFATLVRGSASPESFTRRRPGGMPPPPGRGRGKPFSPPDGFRVPRHPGSPPTALYDVNNQLVAGKAPGHAIATRVPIVVDGDVIGELRSEPRRHLSTPLETAFSKQQLETSWIIGVLSLVLAFGVSLVLAQGLLAPVRRMISSVALLSNGDYSHRMHESRRDELGQLTRDLDRLALTLQQNQSSRRRLLADISHELRTPLTVLSGEIEALEDGLRDFDETQLASLDQEVQRLRYLVDDLYELSLSDIGGLRYQFTNVAFTDCLQAAVNAMSIRSAEQGIELELNGTSDVPLMVFADVKRINQLLQNLLENAMAYTDSPGRVVVTLFQSGASAVMTIDDTPPGVSQSDYGRLFDPLFRDEASRNRRTGGAGLGLSICQNIVTAHGGKISASPSKLGGLCVCVELPVSGDNS